MQRKSFIVQSHFQIYDKIIPLFRLACITILIGLTMMEEGFPHIGKNMWFLIPYLIYSLVLLFSKQTREYIVLRYPLLMGISEMLLATYALWHSGGSQSPFYYCYVLIIAFFGIVYHLSYSLIISFSCAIAFSVALLLLGETLTYPVIIQCIFLVVFAFFIGTVSGKISRYNLSLATSDQLTSLYNRQYFFGELDNFIAQSRQKNHRFCLVLIDVDDFKQINDQKGHLEGDRVLTGVGSLIRQTINREDIAARYGGDEFVILLANADQSAAAAFCEKFTVDVPPHLKGITVSVGYAVYPENGRQTDDLFHFADMDMYQSKMKKKEACGASSQAAPDSPLNE
jgi:diguanylate cyclase (GGDEF)-like protein